MFEPTFHIAFDLIGAAGLLALALLAACGIVLLTSWYWRGRPGFTPFNAGQLLYALPVGLWLMDTQGRVRWRNQETERLLARPPLDGRLETDLAAIVRRAAENGPTALYEIRHTPDARLQIRALPVAGRESAPDQIACVVVDAPDGRTRDGFYQAFIANVSHELLTPLAVIAGHVANIRDSGEAEAAVRNASLATITREVERLTALTGNLLVLSQLEAELPLHWESTNVGALAEQAAADLLGPARQKDIEIAVLTGSRPPRIRADRDQLRRVFLNLVDNAINYCPPGARIQIQLQAGEAHVLIRVADNGPGIPADDLPYIFDKFYRVQKDGTRGRQGSGLGLAIVKRIVERHGGELTVDSQVGAGTTFSVRLPIDAPASG